MGRGNNRRSPKMKQKINQRKKKTRERAMRSGTSNSPRARKPGKR